jgi:hypothetical protein
MPRSHPHISQYCNRIGEDEARFIVGQVISTAAMLMVVVVMMMMMMTMIMMMMVMMVLLLLLLMMMMMAVSERCAGCAGPGLHPLQGLCPPRHQAGELAAHKHRLHKASRFWSKHRL